MICHVLYILERVLANEIHLFRYIVAADPENIQYYNRDLPQTAQITNGDDTAEKRSLPVF